MLVYLLVNWLPLLVTGTVDGTAPLNQFSHEGVVVQFRPCFEAPGQVCQIVAGVFFGSVSTTGDI